MNNSPRKDIPPARRQSTEISLAEIESIGIRPKSKKRKKLGPTLMLLVTAGLVGAGAWQWDTVGPYVIPPLKSAQAMVSGGKAAVMQATTGRKAPSQSAPSQADSSQAISAEGSPAATRPSEQSPSNLPGDPPAEDESNLALIEPAADNGQLPENTDDRPQTLLNHRRYDEANQASLVPLNANSQIKLQPAAQAKLTAMLAKAKADGVNLGIVSGFRTLADQNYLYFDVTAERGESVKTRAEVSAPPGYSEHHTGYAVDFIDEDKPATHVEESFETTAAYAWLKKNAAFYNFEMSFPKDPSSSVGYEPWHWRYVGNQESLELFYK